MTDEAVRPKIISQGHVNDNLYKLLDAGVMYNALNAEHPEITRDDLVGTTNEPGYWKTVDIYIYIYGVSECKYMHLQDQNKEESKELRGGKRYIRGG